MPKTHDIFWFLRPTMVAILIFLVAWIGSKLLIGTHQHADLERPSAERTAKELVHPSPELSPAEVVRVQLEGLSDGQSERGVLQCMTFASPSNRSVTGPLERFGRMVRAKPFDVFADPDRVLIGKTKLVDGKARVLVTVVAGKKLSLFVWVLSKQTDAPYENCWMTDAVFPVMIDKREPNVPPALDPI